MSNNEVKCPFGCGKAMRTEGVSEEHFAMCPKCGWATPHADTHEAALALARRVRVLPEGFEADEDIREVRNMYATWPVGLRLCYGIERNDTARAALATVEGLERKLKEACAERALGPSNEEIAALGDVLHGAYWAYWACPDGGWNSVARAAYAHLRPTHDIETLQRERDEAFAKLEAVREKLRAFRWDEARSLALGLSSADKSAETEMKS